MNISFRADRDSHGKEKADSGYGFDRGGYCDLGVGDVGRATATSAIWRQTRGRQPAMNSS
jgi:hypothetical protein